MYPGLSVLLGMQQNREEEKSKFGHYWTRTGELKQREAMLILELPYRLDPASIGAALPQKKCYKLSDVLKARKKRPRITGTDEKSLPVLYKDRWFQNWLRRHLPDLYIVDYALDKKGYATSTPNQKF